MRLAALLLVRERGESLGLDLDHDGNPELDHALVSNSSVTSVTCPTVIPRNSTGAPTASPRTD